VVALQSLRPSFLAVCRAAVATVLACAATAAAAVAGFRPRLQPLTLAALRFGALLARAQLA
jgi:hypothetical protein